MNREINGIVESYGVDKSLVRQRMVIFGTASRPRDDSSLEYSVVEVTMSYCTIFSFSSVIIYIVDIKELVYVCHRNMNELYYYDCYELVRSVFYTSSFQNE